MSSEQASADDSSRCTSSLGFLLGGSSFKHVSFDEVIVGSTFGTNGDGGVCTGTRFHNLRTLVVSSSDPMKVKIQGTSKPPCGRSDKCRRLPVTTQVMLPLLKGPLQCIFRVFILWS